MRNFKCSDFLRILTNGSQQLKIKKYEKSLYLIQKSEIIKIDCFLLYLMMMILITMTLVQFLGKEEFKKIFKKSKKKIVSGVV